MKIQLPRLKSDSKIIDFPPFYNKTIDNLEEALSTFNDKLDNTDKKMNNMNKIIDDTKKKIDHIYARLDNFYGKLMEIFGIFVAIFSLILTSGYNLSIAKGENISETALNVLMYLSPLTNRVCVIAPIPMKNLLTPFAS